MKYLKVIALLTIISTICTASDVKQKLAAVKAGTQQEARAEWWGFNPKDSTAILQKALNSGVRKLTISKQTGPWIVGKTLELPSNIEIIIEDGAEITAQRGQFVGITECLMKARDKKNITFSGSGTISMNKKDYLNTKKYVLSDHRHTLGFYSCQNIKVEGLTIKNSGGDGIYVNNVNNLQINKIILDNHYRQGISVISGENILIENSIIKNTKGRAPQCGIDFEPNRTDEKLINCRVRNCQFENNAHSAVNVSLGLNNTPPRNVDIIVENCTTTGGNYGFSGMVPGHANAPVGTLRGGRFIIRNCSISNTKASAFYFGSHRTDGEQIIIENCVVNNPNTTLAPIFFLVRGPATGEFGGVHFKNCTINAPKAKELLTFITLMPQCHLTGITGEVVFNNKAVNLKNYINSKGFQNNPNMFRSDIPLLGFQSPSNLKVKRLQTRWHFKIDPTNIGLTKEWQKSSSAQTGKWATIESKTHWEKGKTSSTALKKQLKGYDGIGWYAQSISIPAEWKNKKIFLYCGAIDESALFYLNGKLTGERKHNHPDNWLLPFRINITPNINWSKENQQLIIRVKDTMGGGGIWKPIWLVAE
jgi:hypothetical protein